MRANSQCTVCHQGVREVTSRGETLLLDPSPAFDGYVQVIDWGPAIPHVVIHGSHAEAPGSEPLLYRVHICGRTQ